MATVNAKVSAMVERALKRNPELKSTDLREKAVKIDKAMGKLSGRQFHARYALPARRKLFGSTKSTKTATKRRRMRTTSRDRSDAVTEMLTESYEEKKAALDGALNQAFDRAANGDSVKQMNELLSAIDRSTREFENV